MNMTLQYYNQPHITVEEQIQLLYLQALSPVPSISAKWKSMVGWMTKNQDNGKEYQHDAYA